MQEKNESSADVLCAVLVWGGLWGMFEATAGYLLHLLPFRIGFLVWYPAACFFLFNAYRRTQSIFAVLGTGLLCAGVKLLNLFLPGSVDRVINPAVSIVFEAIGMAGFLWADKRLYRRHSESLWGRGLMILGMNTCWRALYALYQLVLAPGWMLEISVIKSAQAAMEFFLWHNLASSLVLFGGYAVRKALLQPVEQMQNRVSSVLSRLSPRRALGVKTALALLLLFGSIALELAL